MTSEYGTYRLSYTPPETKGYQDYPNISIEMSTDGDASVDQMLKFFEAFLAASGYALKGEIQVVEPESEDWSPHNYVTAGGSQASDVITFRTK